jgi:4-alpha-glucanotransferase
MRFPRAAGILLHPTSLPGRYGIGALGNAAFRFVDLLSECGQSLWQILPLGPTGYGDSPYACFSAMAGNPLLIDLDQLAKEGDVDPADLAGAPHFPDTVVDFGPVITYKFAVLKRAAQRFREQATGKRRQAFDSFCRENASWLEDYALFIALKDTHGGAVWNTWEWGLVSRQSENLAAWRERLDAAMFAQRYFQFQFFRQWEALKCYANNKNIKIVGDIPIFVAYDSVDVWANPELYYLDKDLRPTRVAGVPPDYFSSTGQLWGNPLYRWDVMAQRNNDWWIKRFEQTLRTVDIIRLDHFRGFAAYWEVPADESTAVNGRWAEGPGTPFFEVLRQRLGELPIIAEDLGHITPDVALLRDTFEFPGMDILQFAFTSDAGNPYLPHNLRANSVIYSGTHDNDTTVGWYQTREEEELDALHAYMGPIDEPIHWALIRMAYRSVADIAIIPMQDILGLGTEARMNTPGKFGGNWAWRLTMEDFQTEDRERLKAMAVTYGRAVKEEQHERPTWM